MKRTTTRGALAATDVRYSVATNNAPCGMTSRAASEMSHDMSSRRRPSARGANPMFHVKHSVIAR